MKWRDLIIGSVITLIVTVLGGILVWYLTKEPKAEPSREFLVYEVDRAGDLTIDQAKISFITIRFMNLGNKPAQRVNAIVTFKDGTDIAERQIQSSSGIASNVEVTESTKQRLLLASPVLAAGETITVSMLVRGSGAEGPVVGMRSADTIGEQGVKPTRAFDVSHGAEGTLRSGYIVAIIFAALVVQFATLALIRGPLSKHLNLSSSGQNNTSFLLLHQGLAVEAERILATALEKKGGETYELANMALAQGMLGEVDKAERYFSAAEWGASTNHPKAVIKFNRSTLAFFQGDNSSAKEMLAEAAKLSPKAVEKYAKYSSIIAGATMNDQSIVNIYQSGDNKS